MEGWKYLNYPQLDFSTISIGHYPFFFSKNLGRYLKRKIKDWTAWSLQNMYIFSVKNIYLVFLTGKIYVLALKYLTLMLGQRLSVWVLANFVYFLYLWTNKNFKHLIFVFFSKFNSFFLNHFFVLVQQIKTKDWNVSKYV